MQNKSQSYNTSVLGITPFRFLVPEIPQLFLYLSLSLLILVAVNVPAIWHNLTFGGDDLGQIAQSNAWFYRTWRLISHSNMVAALFWAVIGVAIYLVIWFFRSIATNIRNDLLVANYVHPVAYKEYMFWRSVILRKLIFGVSFTVLLIYLFVGIKTFIGLGNFGYWRIETGLSPLGFAQLIGLIVASIALLHGFTLLLKITLNFWQFIYRDL